MAVWVIFIFCFVSGSKAKPVAECEHETTRLGVAAMNGIEQTKTVVKAKFNVVEIVSRTYRDVHTKRSAHILDINTCSLRLQIFLLCRQ